jgi:O-antigen/teichoic acid export membrane protein
MLKATVQSSLLYSIAGLFSGGALFIVMPFYTRLLSVDDYGVWEYLSILGTLMGVTVALEISQGVARYVPQHRNDPELLRSYASTSLWFTIAAHSVIVLLVTVGSKPLSSFLFDTEEYATVLAVAFGSFGVVAVANQVISQLKWELRAIKSVAISVMNSALSLIFSLGFLWYADMGLAGAFLGPLVGGVLILPVGLWMVGSGYGLTFSTAALRKMLSFSAPLVFSSVGWVLSSYLDRLAVKELLTLQDLAVYGVGFRISGVVMLLMAGLQGAVSPMIFANYSDPATPKNIARLFRLTISIALILCAVLSVFSSEWITLLATSDYIGATVLIPVLSISLVIARLYVFTPGMGIAKKTGLFALVNIISAFLNLGLNYLLIPFFGISGASFATLISAGIALSMFMLLSQRYYPVPHRFLSIMTATMMAFLLIGALTPGVFDFSIGFVPRALGFLLILSIPFIFHLVDKDDVRALVQYVNEVRKRADKG